MKKKNTGQTPKTSKNAKKGINSGAKKSPEKLKHREPKLMEEKTSYGSKIGRSERRPVAIDLFCGAGGMSLGMEMAGFDIVLSVDYDGYHVATHERNFPYGKVKCGSVQDMNANTIKKLSGYEENVDLVFGGPPCQGFSNMGLRDTHDPRNTLIFHFARIVDELRPKAFVMENVTGLNMGATKEVFEAFIQKVSESYNVTLPVKILSANDFGVPQARKRLFVIGIRKDIGATASYPSIPQEKLCPSVIEAIGDLPRIEKFERLFAEDVSAYPAIPDNKYALVLRGLVKGENDFSHKRNWDSKVVTGCQRVKHTESALELYRSTAPGETVPGHKLPRLHPEGICPTLRAGATSERGSHTAPRPIHPKAARVITVREAARLHGYPDWFSFYPSKMHAYRQIGNSVCPPVAHAVGLQVMKALSIDPNLLIRRELELQNTFNLPADRPKQHSRIPVKVEFPKIINYLWNKAYDAKTKKVVNASFGPKEIQEAIKATGANLPRVRPERFLYEASQQRAIKYILAQPIAAGFSIVITDKDKGIGQFQKLGSADSLGLPKAVVITSTDLTEASRIDLKLNLHKDSELLSFIESSLFADNLPGGPWKRLDLERDLLGTIAATPVRANFIKKTGDITRAQVEIFEATNITFERIKKKLSQQNSKNALILMRLTKQHFAAVGLCRTGDTLTETYRKVFFFSKN
jgi:DNA (cytosine-5)-methyltransferase 1